MSEIDRVIGGEVCNLLQREKCKTCSGAFQALEKQILLSSIHYKSYQIEKEPKAAVVRQEQINGNRLENSSRSKKNQGCFSHEKWEYINRFKETKRLTEGRTMPRV